MEIQFNSWFEFPNPDQHTVLIASDLFSSGVAYILDNYAIFLHGSFEKSTFASFYSRKPNVPEEGYSIFGSVINKRE